MKKTAYLYLVVLHFEIISSIIALPVTGDKNGSGNTNNLPPSIVPSVDNKGSRIWKHLAVFGYKSPLAKEERQASAVQRIVTGGKTRTAAQEKWHLLKTLVAKKTNSSSDSQKVASDTTGGLYPDDGGTEEYYFYEETNSTERSEHETYENTAGKPTEDVLPPVALPDDSLADVDLHDHDVIDSVVYIYFGAGSHAEETAKEDAGREVVVVGAAIALVAQILTLGTAIKRIQTQPPEPAIVMINVAVAMGTSNLVLLLGAQATESRHQCEAVALVLHYLHLVSCFWLFLHSLHVYLRLLCKERNTLKLYCLCAWLIPAALVLTSFLLHPGGYEVHSFCWMSVERGMMLSFMVPVSCLILCNTVLVVLGLRLISSQKKRIDSENLRNSLRCGSMLLPVFAVTWFLSVLALENSSILVFPLLYAAVNGFLGWFLFFTAHLLLPESHQKWWHCFSCSCRGSKARDSSGGSDTDTQPLLSEQNSPAASTRVQDLEMHVGYISTIST